MRIELWVNGRLAGGAEQWWDDIDASLLDAGGTGFPLLNRVDPYGEVVFAGGDLVNLAAEARRFSIRAPERLRPFFEKFTSLCDQGAREEHAELRCLGD